MTDPNLAILKPVVVLVAWTIVMLAWLIATRIPAMKAAGVDFGKLIGGKGTDADGVLSARAQWKAHNHNHLMEQPTLFYAIAITLALIGQGGGINAGIAWAYVGRACSTASSRRHGTASRCASPCSCSPASRWSR